MDTEQGHHTTADRTPGPGRYEIDTANSALGFTTRHVFGLLPVRGTLAITAGTVDVVEPLSASSVHAEVAADSFESGSSARDRNVRSPGFLDAERHPVMTFEAGGVEEAPGGARQISGTLTAVGVSRPVTLAVEEWSVGQRDFTVRASTLVDRTDFGVTASPGMTGRRLRVDLRIRCVRS